MGPKSQPLAVPPKHQRAPQAPVPRAHGGPQEGARPVILPTCTPTANLQRLHWLARPAKLRPGACNELFANLRGMVLVFLCLFVCFLVVGELGLDYGGTEHRRVADHQPDSHYKSTLV